jgi:hypothetical protein
VGALSPERIRGFIQRAHSVAHSRLQAVNPDLCDLKCLEKQDVLVLETLTYITPPPQLNGLRQCLDNVDNWAFDVFELERESDKNPLQVPSRPTSTISACMRSHLNVISVSQREFFNS